MPAMQLLKDHHVEVKNVTGRGNGLFVTQDFDIKSLPLFVARPLMVALETTKLSTNCYYCYEPTYPEQDEDKLKLKTCGGCKTVKFCNQQCQKAAWKQYHKLECDVFGRLNPRVLPSTVRAVVRLLRQHEAGLIFPAEWDELLALESHYDELLQAGGEPWKDVFIMSKGIKGYCGTDHSQDTILHLACTLLVNSFTLTNATFESLGMVLHPKSALINHSCDPNAFVRFDVPPEDYATRLPPYGSISVLALRPIKKGEEITISYIDTTMPFDKRQAELQTRYFFHCTCELCTRGPNVIVDFFHLLPEHEEVIPTGLRLRATSEDEKIAAEAEKYLISLQSRSSIVRTQVKEIKAAMKTLADTKCWPLYRYPWPQLRQELLIALIANNKIFEALLQSATLVRAINPTLYPQEHHPIRLMHMWTLTDLCGPCVEAFMDKRADSIQGDVKFAQEMFLGLRVDMINELHKTINTGIRINGQVEEMIDGLYEQARMVRGGTPWVAWQQALSGTRKDLMVQLDDKVEELLKLEGVSQYLIDLAFSRRAYNLQD